MGRPKGSKNKPKVAKAAKKPAVAVVREPDVVEQEEQELDAMDLPDEEDEGTGEEQVSTGQAINRLADATTQIAKTVERMTDNQPMKIVRLKKTSPYNPTGRKRKLDRRYYQNGFRLNVKTLHDEEISLLSQLKPGKYIDNRVNIAEIMNGGDRDVHINYDNKTQEHKMTNAREFTPLTKLLKRCLNEGRSDLQPRD